VRAPLTLFHDPLSSFDYKIVFLGATGFTFAHNLSAWDVRVVASMNKMFYPYSDSNQIPDNMRTVTASFCGFYWMTSGIAMLEFGVDASLSGLIPDIRSTSLFSTSLFSTSLF
jgi:hypothetical protein